MFGLALTLVIFGASVSFTVTVKLQVEVVPLAARAVDVTVVVPTGKKLPDAGDEVTVQVPAVTEKFTLAPQTPGALETVISGGHEIWH